ncbi:hypothetical protein [Humibacillus xanthopallidus]|uniref:Uncharacterized protein n=1 Tax=Humibacillus xanthopallidus TaxID=412689 RepID=A0A543HZP5_9MICO|nr:hypothetical protein [Humibacillus xanthopallidus]TQM63802.1 hypothetical protein FBY41_0155 [Humibacillus xanthopallidus]
MQQSRRSNPYPFTWEIPLMLAVTVLLLLVLGVQAGRAGANLAAGGGLSFPPRDALLTSVPGILAGDARAGLPTTTSGTAGAASPAAVRAWVAGAELIILVVLCWAGRALWLRWGPHRVHGMASKAEAQTLLGRRRLHRVRAITRPDLYGKDRS